MGLLNPEKDIKGQKHILAYITPGEADTLQDLGAEEVLTSEGIPAYPPLGQPGTSPGTRSDYSPGQGHRETYGGPPGGGDYRYRLIYQHLPQPSGPAPHDLSVVDPYGNIALEQEKIDFYEEPESTFEKAKNFYLEHGLIPNAFRLGKAGLEKLGEWSSELQEKAMT